MVCRYVLQGNPYRLGRDVVTQTIDIAGYWTVKVMYNVWLGDYNTGFTKTDMHNRYSIMGIGIADSKEQFFNTVVHEAKHLQSHICGYYNVPEDGEQAAYLIGYIVQQMYNYIK